MMTQGVFYNNSSHCLPPVEPMMTIRIGNKTQSPVTTSNRYSSGYAQASWNPIRVSEEQHRPLSSYPVMPMPPNTHVPYPYLSLPPDPPPIDPLGWQWQPPPSHYPLQISPVSTHHNGYMQGPTVTHQTSGQVYIPSVEVMSATSIPLLHYSSMLPVCKQPAKARVLKQGTPSAKVSSSSLHPGFHAPTSVKLQAEAQTIPSIRSQSISLPRTSALPVKVESLHSTVPTYASHSSSASALVTKDTLTENPLNQLAARCRNFVLSIGSRDHPERSPEEWIKLVSQLDAVRPLFFQKALRQDHIRSEFDQIVQQILVLQQVTSSEVFEDDDHSASAVVIKSPREHKQDLDIPKPFVATTPISLVGSPTVLNTVPLQVTEPTCNPVSGPNVDESGHFSCGEQNQEGQLQDLITRNDPLAHHFEKSDYRYANDILWQPIWINGLGQGHLSYGVSPAHQTPSPPDLPVEPLPPPEPPPLYLPPSESPNELCNQSVEFKAELNHCIPISP
ncbi:hypothetical protein C8R42DRAFT_242021 [Lentinula raphanica]|nr:hypothetical protein C8R42DRAFT_242021 [Lentinula raphanica]